MKDFIKTIKALSDPNRVKIIKMLQHKSMCVCEVQTALKVSQPTVSKHLKILKEVGFVRYEKDGLWVNYHLLANAADSAKSSLLEGKLFPKNPPTFAAFKLMHVKKPLVFQ